MPSVKQLQRGRGGNKTLITRCAALTVLLDTVDVFSMTKKDNAITLTVFVGVSKASFTKEHIYDLTQPLGDWLAKLPKGVWDDKVLFNLQ